MNKALLIIYEPALFLLAALGWAGWEFWSMRSKKDAKAKQKPDSQASEPPSEP